MRRDIEFPSGGSQCLGWLYSPDASAVKPSARAIVMAHGFSAVKEMFHLSSYAERFQTAGFVVLVFDFRFLGASDGNPRGQIISHEQQEDYRNAIAWMSLQTEVDADRIGLWGTSYAGGHVLHLAAFDRRIKAVVAQVPTINPVKQILHRSGTDGLEQFMGMLASDRAQRFQDGIVNYMKVVGLPGELALLGAPGAYEAMMKYASGAPTWVNQVTLESMEYYVEYVPTANIELISPTPLLMVLAEHDSLIPVELARSAFDRAGDPKKLEVLPCGHFEVYDTEPWFSDAVSSMVE